MSSDTLKLPSNDQLSALNAEMLEWAKSNGMDFAKLMAYYKCAMMEIETKFNVLNVEYSLRLDRNPISSIHARLKKPRSIAQKLQRLNVPITLESLENTINDVAGVRVICPFPQDVYDLADALLKQDDIVLVQKKDYIANPKPNGYRSLHLIVKVPIFLAHEKRLMTVEIQLRTIAMDSWATLEHQLRYKKDHSFTEEMAQELLRCAHLSSELDFRMDKLRNLVGIASQLSDEDVED
ncbi:MAG: GTP pyrophosphokinase family protein [Clostridia bacterium]|nr:GTP pyrophosphokinase family protein [Clostridia bacterium]